MDRIITNFIEAQKLASVCCLDPDNHPYCFNIFYVFDKVDRRLYFKSSSTSAHAWYLVRNKKVAGTILPDKLNMLALQGVQFTGFILDDAHVSRHHVAAEYYKRFPFAMAMPGALWGIQLESIKMTDNTLNFGKTISWHREDLYEEIC